MGTPTPESRRKLAIVRRGSAVDDEGSKIGGADSESCLVVVGVVLLRDVVDFLIFEVVDGSGESEILIVLLVITFSMAVRVFLGSTEGSVETSC
jgi:hypothetical protein